MLPAQVGEELVAGDGEVPYPALQEIAGQGGLGRDQSAPAAQPSPRLPGRGRRAGQSILLVGPFLGPNLG